MARDYTVLNEKNGTCPICGADHKNDNKCKLWNSGIISCFRENTAEVGEELNGYRYVGEDRAGFGSWKPAEQWDDKKTPSTQPKQKQRQVDVKHIPLAGLDLRLGDPIDVSSILRPTTPGSYEQLYNDGRGVTRDSRKNFPCWREGASLDVRESGEGDRNEWHFYGQGIIKPGGTLLLVEGEQSVLGALGAGFQAAASVHGAGANDVDFLALRLSNGVKQNWDGVVYLADNDEQGLKKAEKMRLAAAEAKVPFAVIKAVDIPELANIKGGSIDDLTSKLDGSGRGLSGDEVVALLGAAFEASGAVDEAIEDHLDRQAQVQEIDSLLSSESLDIVELLPPQIGDATQVLAETFPCHPESLLAIMLPLFGAVMGASHTVEPFPGFNPQGPRIFSGLGLESGAAKSPITKIVTAPVEAWDKAERRAYTEAKKAYQESDSKGGAPKSPRRYLYKSMGSQRGLLRHISSGNSNGSLQVIDEFGSHLSVVSKNSRNGMGYDWNKGNECKLADGDDVSAENKKEEDSICVFDDYLVNRIGLIQPGVLKAQLDSGDDSGAMSRYTWFVPPFVERQVIDFQQSTMAQEVFQEHWGSLLKIARGWVGTRWLMDEESREVFRLYMNRMVGKSRYERGAIFQQLHSKADSRVMRISLIIAGMRVAEAQLRGLDEGTGAAYCGLGTVIRSDIEAAIRIHDHTIKTLRRFYVGDQAVSDVDPDVAKVLGVPKVKELIIGEKVSPSVIAKSIRSMSTDDCAQAVQHLAELKPDTYAIEGKSLKRLK